MDHLVILSSFGPVWIVGGRGVVQLDFEFLANLVGDVEERRSQVRQGSLRVLLHDHSVVLVELVEERISHPLTEVSVRRVEALLRTENNVLSEPGLDLSEIHVQLSASFPLGFANEKLCPRLE